VTVLYQENSESETAENTLRLLLKAIAGQDRQLGVFGETRITGSEFAEIENRTSIRFDAPGVEALGAETRGRAIRASVIWMCHSGRITQLKGQPVVEVCLTGIIIKCSFVVTFTIVNMILAACSSSVKRSALL
jgi:hypothetical protein